MDTWAIVLIIFFVMILIWSLIDVLTDEKQHSYWVCYYNNVPEFAREHLNTKCTSRKKNGEFKYKECAKCPYRDKSNDKEMNTLHIE